jgi:hypothetical protein
MSNVLRIWAAIACLSLLAACQQPTGTTQPSSSAANSLNDMPFGAAKSGKMRFFEPEADALGKQLVAGLIEACFNQIADQDRLHGCMRERLAAAFDDSGKGRDQCGHFSDIDAFADCVLVGNVVLQIRHRLDDDTPVAPDFWASRQTMLQAMLKSVLIGAMTNCTGTASEDALVACTDKWFTRQLALPDEFMRRCDAHLSDDDHEACLGEGITVQFMREHIGRLSALPI